MSPLDPRSEKQTCSNWAPRFGRYLGSYNLLVVVPSYPVPQLLESFSWFSGGGGSEDSQVVEAWTFRTSKVSPSLGRCSLQSCFSPSAGVFALWVGFGALNLLG